MATYLRSDDFSSQSALDSLESGYFIIDDDLSIRLSGNDTLNAIPRLKFPRNSIIDFRGGSITCDNDIILDMQGSQIYSAPYCIFKKHIFPLNGGNSVIRTEWFNDPDYKENNSSAEIIGDVDYSLHINKAIACGASVYDSESIEVVLEDRVYPLKESIHIKTSYKLRPLDEDTIKIAPKFVQKLTVPGRLVLLAPSSDKELPSFKNRPLIKVSSSNVTLNVNFLKGFTDDKGKFMGIGIQVDSNCFHSDFNVFGMDSLHRGFSMEPQFNNGNRTGIQYCRFNFQTINADYGFYVDPFPNKDSLATYNWFTENQVKGGRLQGGYGIYFFGFDEVSTPSACDGLVFSNIGFEGLTQTPLTLCGVEASEFTQLRMFEGLPGLENPYNSDIIWVNLKDVRSVRIGMKGTVLPNRFQAKNCKNVVVTGYIADMLDASRYHFDTLLFLPYSKDDGYKFETLMVATSSVQPYNMEKVVKSSDFTAIDNNGTKSVKILPADLLPYNHTLYKYEESSKIEYVSDFPILPRKARIITEASYFTELDLSFLHLLANFLFEIDVIVAENAPLRLRYDFYNPNQNIDKPNKYYYAGIILNNEFNDDNIKTNLHQVDLTSPGRYGISFDHNWNLILSKY